MSGKQIYEDYCKAVGGVNFQGNPLPTWDELASDHQVGWNILSDKYENKEGVKCKCDACGRVHLCRRLDCYDFCKICAEMTASWGYNNILSCGQDTEPDESENEEC
jgi:hypothetical protein